MFCVGNINVSGLRFFMAFNECWLCAMFLESVGRMILGVCLCVCTRVPFLSLIIHVGAVCVYDFNHPSKYPVTIGQLVSRSFHFLDFAL